MSDHKINSAAAATAMLPPLLPPGHIVDILPHIAIESALGVLLCPADRMRATEDGRWEVCQPNSDVWERVRDDVRAVHPIGEPLPPELCDVVILIGTQVQDQLGSGLLAPRSGGRQLYPTSVVMHNVLARIPLPAWQQQHLNQLKGIAG